jgi:hypothetical protein
MFAAPFSTQMRRLSIEESILIGNGIGDEEGDHSIR